MEIKAAALNFRDVLIALGLLKDYYASVLKIERPQDIRLGFDCAGTIAAVGEEVTDFKVGDEVMSSAVGGSASYLTLPRTDVVRKPAALSFEAAAAIPTVFFTAHLRLAAAGAPQGGRANADPRGGRRRRPGRRATGAGGRRGDLCDRESREVGVS